MQSLGITWHGPGLGRQATKRGIFPIDRIHSGNALAGIDGFEFATAVEDQVQCLARSFCCFFFLGGNWCPNTKLIWKVPMHPHACSSLLVDTTLQASGFLFCKLPDASRTLDIRQGWPHHNTSFKLPWRLVGITYQNNLWVQVAGTSCSSAHFLWSWTHFGLDARFLSWMQWAAWQFGALQHQRLETWHLQATIEFNANEILLFGHVSLPGSFLLFNGSLHRFRVILQKKIFPEGQTQQTIILISF